MNGYWHLIGLSATIAIVSITYEAYFLFGLLMIWLYLLYRKDRITIRQLTMILMISVFVSGYYFPLETNTPLKTEEEQQLTGTIVSEINKQKTYYSFIFQHKANQQKERLQVTYFIDEPTALPTSWKTGATCQLTGTPELPSKSKNPGEFDYQVYLLHKNITKQMNITDTKALRCSGSSFLHLFYRMRATVMEKVTERISPFTSAWLKALLFGNDHALDSAIVTQFQRWNLSHLLAISGLHVGLIVGFLFFIFVKTGVARKEKSIIIIMGVLIIYPLLSGGAPSVWRACFMTTFGMLMIQQQRKMRILDILSIIFLLCILFNKQWIFQLGFQFSFLVTLSLILSKQWLNRSTKLQVLVRVSFISMFSLLPLQLMHFYFFNPLALIVNILILPYFTLLVIPLLLIILSLLLLFPVFAVTLDQGFLKVHSFVLTLLDWIDDQMFYPIVTGDFSVFYLLLYYLLFFALCVVIEYRKKKQAVFLILALLSWLFWLEVKPYTNPYGTVTMLDIGQGDTIVIELPYRKGVFMIDVAGEMAHNFETPSDQIYKQVIKPFLYRKGINKIDMVILSHADHDHIGSLPYLLEGFDVKHLVISDYFDLTRLQETASNNISVATVKKGDIIEYNNQAFQVLHPVTRLQERNDNSLVLFAEIGELTWLFTGDISKEIENELMVTYPQLTADVLKLAHHGSSDSSTSAFLQALHPDLALISVGEKNRYGHPAKDVLDRLKQLDIVTLRTDQQGAITYTYKDNGEQGTFSTFLP
ncbi:DNA internalization-related competence protein ComEC/Rec2 [Paraliobacillus ryukyuensis]|uniref:DNA internalization-related competence protein ComEC/Rec2 n=1 Tax=Paraliobacillus ryukyuensis TaxID=200904 RepID=UPI0009A629A5|nr:DNA internalization-related competence protein ComEC/Rec2 [Paraliobacillus ryukyuensis]